MPKVINLRGAGFEFGRGRVQASRNPQKAQYYLRVKDELGCSGLL